MRTKTGVTWKNLHLYTFFGQAAPQDAKETDQYPCTIALCCLPQETETEEISDEWRKALIFKKDQRTKSGELQVIEFHFVSGKIIKSLWVTSLGIWRRRRRWLGCKG